MIRSNLRRWKRKMMKRFMELDVGVNPRFSEVWSDNNIERKTQHFDCSETRYYYIVLLLLLCR